MDTAEQVYDNLVRKGFEVLFDDRDESAGVKFNDADLLGMPIRVTISDRSLKTGGAEVKLRREEAPSIIAIEGLEEVLMKLVNEESLRYTPK